MEVDKNISKILLDEIQYVQEYIRNNSQKINETNSCGLTYLMVACQLGNTDFINFLLESGADLEVSDKEGDTALHYAVFGHQCDGVALMVSKGANINCQDKSGNTPLHYAVGKNYEDVMEIILNTKATQSDVAVDIKNCNKMTPLLQAISGGHLRMIHKLLSHGADINAVDNDDNNCLHLAVKKGMFHSEGEALGILDECCAMLELGKNARLSGAVIATYLALQGANFYHRNHNNANPLDLVENPDLKEKLKSNFPSLCLFCEVKASTLKCQSCGHVVICEECGIKTCPECQKHITRKSRIESPKLKEKDLLKVAKKLGSNWWQVGIFLGVKTSELEIHDNSKDNVKQGYVVLHKWFKSCDLEKRTLKTLEDALKEAECVDALKSLSADVK
ncbi:26S proteasome non-ATPase regulatory subunit 10 [Octopus bimaculoides]|uniref:Death domain-containing protein n=1 Tax=Octopus bimaculoides TaxID=37653 RepID=A0A0L8GA88_OCTBM|nr:26S proteasome non-ATPase regulatory subunit 10 [Octopus bimaculoides]|eukprot:XP_014782788.1 PREDICTED: 26S proteasome non-ATPase regulatory subunit 10-like [Octopus bimaculoides]